MKKTLAILVMVISLALTGYVQAKELPSKPVKINSATKEELMLLPGVGEKKAEVIISTRAQKPILNEVDLKDIKGVGDKMALKWSGLIDYTTDQAIKK
jgi:competence ComEA-like helix-hairpin-helix protein